MCSACGSYSCCLFGIQGKAAGSRHAVWIRWQLQWRLFGLGCFIQRHAGKVLFLGILLLSLCCVGLKTAALETTVERLWVEGTPLHLYLSRSRGMINRSVGNANISRIPTQYNR